MRTSIWFQNPAIEDLTLICFLLNGDGELVQGFMRPKGEQLTAIRGVQQELRRLVEKWDGLGRDGQKLLETGGDIAERIQKVTARLVFDNKKKAFRLAWPSLQLPRRIHPPTQQERWQDFAFHHFANLLLNPYLEMLGGPCARCGRYFVKKTVRQKVYCSRRCDKAAGAIAATEKRREEEREEKLDRARKAVNRWTRTSTKLDWKSWIVKTERSLTKTFLTQSVNRGQLQPPKKGRPQ